MPYYPFKCEDCKTTFEEYQRISDDHKAVCPGCGKKAQRIWNMPFAFSFDFKYGYDIGAGAYFDSNKQRNEYIARHGLRRRKS